MNLVGRHMYDRTMDDCIKAQNGRQFDPYQEYTPTCLFMTQIKALDKHPPSSELRYCVNSTVSLKDNDTTWILSAVNECMSFTVHDRDYDPTANIKGMNDCAKFELINAVQNIGLTVGELMVTHGRPGSKLAEEEMVTASVTVIEGSNREAKRAREVCTDIAEEDIRRDMSVWYMSVWHMPPALHYMNNAETCFRRFDALPHGTQAMIRDEDFIQECRAIVQAHYDIQMMSANMTSAVRWRNVGIATSVAVITSTAVNVGARYENRMCMAILGLYEQYRTPVRAAVGVLVAKITREATVHLVAYLFGLDTEEWKVELAILKTAGMDHGVWIGLFKRLWNRGQRRFYPDAPLVVVDEADADADHADDAAEAGGLPLPQAPVPAPSARPMNRAQQLRVEKEKREERAKQVGEDGRRIINPDDMQRSLDEAAKKLAGKAKKPAGKAKKPTGKKPTGKAKGKPTGRITRAQAAKNDAAKAAKKAAAPAA